MKKLILLLIIPFLIPDQMFAQLASDYYPLHVGNYWVQHTDTISGGYQPTTFRTDIEAIDLIGGEEYFRMSQSFIEDDGSSVSGWYLWGRFDSNGFVIGAFGDTSIVDSATTFDTPLPFFPNEALNLGYSWEFDWPGTGVGDQHWYCLVESISETVEVPAGIFNDCIKIKLIITDTSGDTTQWNYFYYAEGIGQVLNVGWNMWWGNFEFELIEYSVQLSVGDNVATGIPIHFRLQQNYPNPFNPVTTIHYQLPQKSDVQITIYDMLGREVRTLVSETQDVGYYSVIWDATNDQGRPVSAGVYLYKIQAGEFVQSMKMVLLK